MAKGRVVYIDEIETVPDSVPPHSVQEFLIKAGAQQEQAEFQSNAPPARYALPKTVKDIEQARKGSTPANTQRDTQWCMSVWNDWSNERNKLIADDKAPADPAVLDNRSVFTHWLELFVLEVRTKNGEEYAPNTLHHLVCGIMRHCRTSSMPSVDFFQDPEFANFRRMLDSKMKRIQKKGKGSTKKKGEPLTVKDEELLWEKGVLGDHSPQALLSTIFFTSGLYFAL